MQAVLYTTVENNIEYSIANNNIITIKLIGGIIMFNSMEYNAEFKKKNYDTVVVYLPKGEKSRLKELAENQGLSLNKFVVGLLCGGSENKQDNRQPMPENISALSKMLTYSSDDIREQLPF